MPAGIPEQQPPTRNINSSRPFRRTVHKYRAKGWQGPIPLPPHEKHPPPTGTIGRNGKDADDEQIADWLDGNIDWKTNPRSDFRHTDPRKANIGLRLGPVEAVPGFEVVGLDVDDYIDGEVTKTGGVQLAALEAKLGALPATVVSGSRPGVSGIRFFLAPTGYLYRGKAAEHIDMITRGLRFAVVWPSWHPAGGQYQWRESCGCASSPGRNFTGTTAEPERATFGDTDTSSQCPHDGGLVPCEDIPAAADLPKLPKKWLDYLTQSGVRDEGVPMEMDSTADEIRDWATSVLPTGTVPCRQVRQAISRHKTKIDNDVSRHDKMLNAHFHFYRLASEGHTGWASAIAAVEKYWREDKVTRGKRTIGQMRGELFRSKVNALRKLKGDIELHHEMGSEFVAGRCACFRDPALFEGAEDGMVVSGSGDAAHSRDDRTGDGVSTPGPITIEPDGSPSPVPGNTSAGVYTLKKTVVPRAKTKKKTPPHQGNGVGASHDSSDTDGPTIGPITMHTPHKDPDEYQRSDDGNAEHWLHLIGAGNVHWIPALSQWILWSETERRWVTDIDGLGRRIFRRVRDRQELYAKQLLDNATAHAERGQDAPAKILSQKGKEWMDWSKRSGCNKPAIEAMEAAKSVAGVTIAAESLDANPFLLGVDGGVIQLNPSDKEAPWTLREARREDLITHNTGTPVIEPGTDEHGEKLWSTYLDTFLPDVELRRFIQKVLGYGILGNNQERIFVFLSGPTTTGKGTMIAGLSRALGQYGAPAGVQVFQDHKLNPALAEALPMRLVMLDELSSSVTLNSDVVKRLTGGLALSAELKGSNTSVKRTPAFLPIVATNQPPRMPDADDAVKRRLVVLPFTEQMSRSQEDTSVSSHIAAEGGPVVLRWLLDGWSTYVREGLGESSRPGAVRKATDVFHSELSDLGTYVAERIRRVPAQGRTRSRIPTADAYADYQTWCSVNNTADRDRLTAIRFSRAMHAQGFEISAQRVDGKVVRCVMDAAIGEPVKRRTLRKRTVKRNLKAVD